MLARRLTLGLLAALSTGVLSSSARAQQESSAPSVPVTKASLVQGELKALPADFFAELEQSRLQLKLEDFGMMEAPGSLNDTLVTLVTPSGETQRAQTDAVGNVTFDGVQPGPVGLVVTGAGRHASVAVYAQDTDRPASAFTLPVMRVTGSEVLKHTAGYADGTGAVDYAAQDYAGFARTSTEPVNYFQVALQADGSLPGRVFTVVDPDLLPDYSGTNVTLYQGGVEVARTVSDTSGSFHFAQIAPGFYGVIAAGPSGYGAFGFEVVPPAPLGQALPLPATASFRQVAMQPPAMAPAGQLYVMLLPPSMLPALLDAINQAYGVNPEIVDGFPVGPPLPFAPGMGPMGGFGGGFPGGGGFGGGGSMGGGGGGGLGGLGGLAGLAALGGIAAVIASEDDDDEFVVPGPLSPKE